MVHPGVCVVIGGASGAESGNGTLADDGTDLARGGGDTVGSRTVSGWEDFTGDDESRSIWACTVFPFVSGTQEMAVGKIALYKRVDSPKLKKNWART